MTDVSDLGATDQRSSLGRLLLPFLLGGGLLLGLVRPAESQEPVVLGLEPGADTPVPIRLELVRRPGELRLDPATGAVSGLGAAAGPMGLLAHDPGTGALVAVDLVPVRLPGRVRLDPRTGVPTAEGLATPAPTAPPPVLVGLDRTTGALAAVELDFVRMPGAFALDPSSGTISPSPDNAAFLGFDPASGTLVPVRISVVPARGLVFDPGTGRLSAAAETGPGTVELLGVRPMNGAIVPVDFDLVHRPGMLAIDPRTGILAPPGQAAEPGVTALTVLGIHTPTGALTRLDVTNTPRPGQYAVNFATGRAEPVAAPALETERPESGFLVGGGVAILQMLELGNVLEQVSVGTPNASEVVPGVRAFAEYAWRAISIGAEAGYTVLESEVIFPQGLQRGDVSYLEVGGSLKIRIPIDAPITPFATASILGAWFDGDFDLEGLVEARTHEAMRAGLGGGFDYWGTPNWGVRLEAVYNTTFEQDDAADHIRYGIGVLYSPGGMGADGD
ncbi:MAG TPA: outer membrane beta-barrel protein [Gemmatimonadota bacterium]|nr:outer membrane beta-barrel protein [Gemmatimonadota bacterium]